jgi:hypothetical protein
MMLQFEQDLGDTCFFQQDDAPPHFHCNVTDFLSEHLPG